MPMDSYGRDEKVETFAEHLLPPVVTYLLRKVVLYLMYANVFVLTHVSKVYGFNLNIELSDRESWKWEVKEKLPVYRAQVEKVN